MRAPRGHPLVLMPVMDVRIVPVGVHERLMNVCMGMRFAPFPLEIVSMLVMLIVEMSVSVLLMRVGVQVHVTLANMQPYAHGHEGSRNTKLPRNGVVVKQNRERHTKEGRHREVGAGASRTQVAESEHE